MIKVAFCDDELIFLNQYAEIMNSFKIKYCFEFYKFTSGEELVNYMTIHEMKFDLLFLDILMDNMNGIETAKKIREVDQNVEIVFLTNTSEYALESYQIKAYNYIIKQCDQLENKIIEAINHAKARKKEFLLVVNKSGVEKVEVSKITYIESNKRKVIIHTLEGIYEMYDKLELIEEKLNSYKFVRTHRSYLLNLDYVKRIESKEIITTTNDYIPISRGRSDEIKEIFMQYLEI